MSDGVLVHLAKNLIVFLVLRVKLAHLEVVLGLLAENVVAQVGRIHDVVPIS